MGLVKKFVVTPSGVECLNCKRVTNTPRRFCADVKRFTPEGETTNVISLGGFMPIYEYYCTSCEKRFEELVLEKKQAVVHCPACGTDEVNRLISLFATTSPGANDIAEMSGESSGHACGCGHCSCGHG
jgi:putative FmdB family regulatory protein